MPTGTKYRTSLHSWGSSKLGFREYSESSKVSSRSEPMYTLKNAIANFSLNSRETRSRRRFTLRVTGNCTLRNLNRRLTVSVCINQRSPGFSRFHQRLRCTRASNTNASSGFSSGSLRRHGLRDCPRIRAMWRIAIHWRYRYVNTYILPSPYPLQTRNLLSPSQFVPRLSCAPS
jgi:hypothetical protein